MHELSQKQLTTKVARLIIREHYGKKPEFIQLLETSMDKKAQNLHWKVNVDSLYNNF